MLQSGSPAIGAGAIVNGITTDQRGQPRPASNPDVGAFQTNPYLVTTAAEPGGIAGQLSLREAINLADVDNSGTSITITFAADPGQTFATPQTIALADTLNLGNGTPGESIIIVGPAAPLTIQGGGSESDFSVITVAENTTATLENLTISNGYASNGGGIYNGGTLTVSNCTISGNCASGWLPTGTGGGIYNNGTLTVSNSTLFGNSAGWDGGGIYNDYGTVTVSNSTLSGNSAEYDSGGGIYNTGTVTVSNSTLSGNSAEWYGGGICNYGTVTVSNSTLSGNSAEYGGGICNYYDTVTLFSTIVAGNTGSYPDISGTVTSDSAYNLIGDGTSMTGISNGDANHNQVGTSSNPIDPMLDPLGNYGGPTQTMRLQAASPAIGAGEIVDGITTDQRGYPRPAINPDIGAYQTPFYTVINTSNSSAVIGSLPYAVAQADSDTSGTLFTISFDPTVFATPQTIGLAGTLNLENTTPGESIIIVGPAVPLTVEGGGSGSDFSVFTVAAGTTATLEELTISNGYTSGGGGGIYNCGTLTVSNSTLSGNYAAGEWWPYGGGGGGIYNGGTLIVSNCTLSSNSAGGGPGGGNGGGIYNGGTVTVSNSTFSGNSASGWSYGGGGNGGGIYNGGTLIVSDCTLSGNSAGGGPGEEKAAASTTVAR